MILIFGGTTEGRIAVNVCDQAGKPYYYATKGNIQEVEAAHAIRSTGALDKKAMLDFCMEKDIKLIIDVAHPFAEILHQNIAEVSKELHLPVVRLERNYTEHDNDITWFSNYEEAINYLNKHKIENLLALTGVNTISKLKPYWEKHACWFRILDRKESKEIVEKEGFPKEKVLYFEEGGDEYKLYKELKPQAIITKESGASGGFNEKIAAAKQLNIPVFVVKRPPLDRTFISVFGEHGLRKKIETLLPDFFPLKTGYTTGTCATAASKAAIMCLLTQEEVDKVSVTLPSGEQIFIPIDSCQITNDRASCTVIKDAGDDPDITHGQQIVSEVRLNEEKQGIHFLQGKGVGKVTLPGLDSKIGEPSINKTPRMMIKRELFKVMRHYQDKLPHQSLKAGVDVTISVPNGEELALKTFNPKLGIVGGISIIGTSGIVKPFSSDAFIASIKREMQVAKALSCRHIVINSGAKSERFIKSRYSDLSPQAFIHYGNFIGETIKIANELDVKRLSLGIMLGKAVKLAEGFLDTHSKKVVMNKSFLKEIAQESNLTEEILNKIDEITMARQLWEIIPENHMFFHMLLKRCYNVCKPLFPKGVLEVLLMDEDGKIIQ